MNNLLKSRAFKYFIYFILLCILTYGIDYLFRAEHKDIIRTVSISFGITTGMYVFTRKRNL